MGEAAAAAVGVEARVERAATAGKEEEEEEARGVEGVRGAARPSLGPEMWTTVGSSGGSVGLGVIVFRGAAC